MLVVSVFKEVIIMGKKQGNLSIDSDNIFPIIKKWLYSDQDIFIRELVSNGCDAITKLKKLEMIGDYTPEEGKEYEIKVIADDKNKTLTIVDNGIGMTADEVEEYINRIAFSGATDFLEKYKDKANDDQIIGHFGLGFYSAFMVADEVHIDTLSYQEGAQAVHWECDGGTTFTLEEGTQAEVGTKITLFLNEECTQYANEYRVREVLEKYCSFLPTPIYLENPNAPVPEKKEGEEAKEEAPKPVNDTNPLWMKHPNECTEEEYKEFFRKVFMDYKEPLFWIHLNMDYPFNLKGILYFPKINTEYDSIEGKIKLYNNQVFIADNIKEVIPEFLMLLKGVIDCPDLPLNVSRSALQNDGFVTKISDYITKKVADKLSGMCKVDKENYEKYWDDIAPFIKFGFLKDPKFAEKINDYILFKTTDDKYLTLPECLKVEEEAEEAKEEKDDAAQTAPETESKGAEDGKEAEEAAPEEEEKAKKTIYYITDEKQQSQYIRMFKENGMMAVYLTHNIDSPFINALEQKNEKIRFLRIDADMNEALTESFDETEAKEMEETLAPLFQKTLGKDKLTVKAEALKDEGIASVLTLSEESRRMEDMMKMYAMYGMGSDAFPKEETLILNVKHPLVKYLCSNDQSAYTEMIVKQLYDLAALAVEPLTGDAMREFLLRSNELMRLLTE